jgi:hypothetical protein
MLPEATTSPRWPKGVLGLTVALAALSPLALWSGRVPGLGEFDYLIFYRLLFYNDVQNALAMLAALLVALAVPAFRAQVSRLAEWLTQHPVRGCTIAFVGLAAAARLVYQGFPLAMDEYAPLLQARIFAQGDIAITYPPELLDRMVVPGFQGMFILVNHETGQAASAYWPGLALLMTPFAWFGGEWLLNPLMGAVGLWLIGDLARQASGREEARGWAMLAALACPQYTVNALSFYAMPGLLTLNLLFLWLLLRSDWKSSLLAGLVGSMALVLHNPVPHTLFALPVGVWLLADKTRRRQLLPLGLGYLPLTALLLFGWPMLTDAMGLRPIPHAPTNTPLAQLWLQKLHQIFTLPSTGLLTVRSYALWKTLVWTAPGLLLIGCILRPQTTIQRVLLGAFVLTFAFYFFVPFDQGHGWGYRYIHSAWALVPIAAAIFATQGPLASRALVASAIAAGLLATPVFLWTTRSTIASAIAQQPSAPRNGLSYVFIANRPGRYTIDLIRNYPSDKGRIVRMLGTDMQNDRSLMQTLAPGAALYSADVRGATWVLPPNAPAKPR